MSRPLLARFRALALRARAAGLDPNMSLDHWDDTTKVTFDHQTWDELCLLRFIDAGHNVMIMGPVGVGKTFRATALGHAAATPSSPNAPTSSSSNSRHPGSTTA